MAKRKKKKPKGKPAEHANAGFSYLYLATALFIPQIIIPNSTFPDGLIKIVVWLLLILCHFRISPSLTKNST